MNMILDIDYNLWRCGEHTPDASLGSGKTALTQYDSIQPHSCCCIGLMFLAVGAEPCQLVGRSTASMLASDALDGAVAELWDALTDYAADDNETTSTAYRINDGESTGGESTGGAYNRLTIPQRMAELTDLFEVHDVATLNWINVPEDVDKAYRERLDELKSLGDLE